MHDTINKRGRPWQFAQELMLVMLKRIDDAGDLKKLNLLNIVNEAHLNTVYEEASTGRGRERSLLRRACSCLRSTVVGL